MASRYDQYVTSPAEPPAVDMGNYGKSRYDQYVSPPAPAGYTGKLPPSPAELDEQDSGFFGRVGADLRKRNAMADEIVAANNAGNQGAMESIGQIAGKVVAGAGNDIIGEGLKSAGSGIAAVTPDAIKAPVSLYAKSAKDFVLNSDLGKVGMDAARRGIDYYKQFAAENPRATRDIESVVNIGTLLPLGKAIAPASDAAGGILSKGGTALKESADAKSIAKQVTGDNLKGWSEAAYKAADELGAPIAPGETNKWLDMAAKALPQTEEGKLALGNSTATDFISRISILRDKSLSFAGAEEIDKGLGAEISKAYRAGDKSEAARFIAIQDGLRDAVGSLPEASEQIKNAKGLWSAASNQRLIENIKKGAEYTDNPATSIKAGFRTLSKKIADNPRGWTESEISAINHAAKTGILTDILRISGSRLGPIIAGAGGLASGGPLGGAAASGASYATSALARKGATALQSARAAKVSEAIMQRPVVQSAIKSATETGELSPRITAKGTTGSALNAVGQLMQGKNPLSMAEIMKLPPAEARIALQQMKALPAPAKDLSAATDGTIRLQTNAERDAGILARQRGAETGLTMDVRNAQSKMQATNQAEIDRLIKSDAWDRIDTATKERISAQIEQAWKNNLAPLPDIINQAKADVEDLMAHKGHDITNTALRDALLGATKRR